MTCQHCHERECNAARRLCRRCWADRGIRCQYAQIRKTWTADDGAGMTEAELDALVEERRATMPKR